MLARRCAVLCCAVLTPFPPKPTHTCLVRPHLLPGVYNHQLPVFLSVLAAYTVSRGLAQSIYDALAQVGG